MLESNRRGSIVISILFGIVFVSLLASQTLAPLVLGGIFALYFGTVALLTLQAPFRRWLVQANQPRFAPPRVTRAATAALDKVPSHAGRLHPIYTLQDIGLIIDERRRDGIHLHHARFLTLEEESIRPYLVLHLDPNHYDHVALLRFELNDTAGKAQFVYEMEYKMRAGENLIIPDYRLPLKGNSRLDRTGTWDLEIRLEEQVIAVHHFSLLPALTDRLRQTGHDGEIAARERLIAPELDERLPLSLEELLNRG